MSSLGRDRLTGRRRLGYNRPLLSDDGDQRSRFTDPGVIRERVVDALPDVLVSGRLKPVEPLLRSRLLRSDGERALLPVGATPAAEPR